MTSFLHGLAPGGNPENYQVPMGHSGNRVDEEMGPEAEDLLLPGLS
jgi:hypothetical protein